MIAQKNAPRPRAHDVDRHVGARVRECRITLGMTQHQLAALIGVTYQQVHKYETGVNRVAAGGLYRIARVLGVDVGHFYEDFAEHERIFLPTAQQRMLHELSRNFVKIPDQEHREALAYLARALAEPENEEGLAP